MRPLETVSQAEGKGGLEMREGMRRESVWLCLSKSVSVG